MKLTAISLLLVCSLTAVADDYDQNKPFGFCTVDSRTDATQTYDMTGGGCWTYPIPDDFTGNFITIKATGYDQKGQIQNLVNGKTKAPDGQPYKVIILDGSDGPFIISQNIGITSSNKTIIGINNATLRTQWQLTDEMKAALDAADVPTKSTTSGGGILPNGKSVGEDAEYYTRKVMLEQFGVGNDEDYRNSGIFSISSTNIIIRNLTLEGPGSFDVGGSDLISATSAKHIWVDHCTFQDGMDGNFDITNKANYITVSWCKFQYTDRSYMHQNTNLIGSSDSETAGFLNTTFAYNNWAAGCKQRMPMGRVGKIHMLNNYFTCSGSSNGINPRKNSEFLIDGNYFASGVKKYYSQSDATAVTWTSNNIIKEASSLPANVGSTVTVPYSNFTVAPAADVPSIVEAGVGPTLFNGSTGIENIHTNTATTEKRHAYNLAGQRVGDDARGLVIINGRLVIRK